MIRNVTKRDLRYDVRLATGLLFRFIISFTWHAQMIQIRTNDVETIYNIYIYKGSEYMLVLS